jgi:septin family protein
MVVGESGLGKSTLINSLFLTDLYPGKLVIIFFSKNRRCPTSAVRVRTWRASLVIERTLHADLMVMRVLCTAHMTTFECGNPVSAVWC